MCWFNFIRNFIMNKEGLNLIYLLFQLKVMVNFVYRQKWLLFENHFYRDLWSTFQDDLSIISYKNIFQLRFSVVLLINNKPLRLFKLWFQYWFTFDFFAQVTRNKNHYRSWKTLFMDDVLLIFYLRRKCYTLHTCKKFHRINGCSS